MITGDGDGFLYEIIANKRNGLDVDKLDYIVRDSTAIGWNVPIDIQRIISNTKVIDNHLTYNKKLHDDIFEVFRLRYVLHKKVYCHHAVLGVELLILDILRSLDVGAEADDHVIYGRKHPLVARLERRGHYKAVHYALSAQQPSPEEIGRIRSSFGDDKVRVVSRVIGFGQGEHPLRNMSWYDAQHGGKVDVPWRDTPGMSRCYEEFLLAMYRV